jgi:cell division protein ZapE
MPLDLYHDHIAQGFLFPNPEQRRVVEHFSHLRPKIDAYLTKRGQHRPWKFWEKTPAPPQGVYLVGDVGTGKTAMMDLFCQSLLKEVVYRQHFHAFMHHIHDQLGKIKHQKDPLKKIAQAWSVPILCLDEFLVQDIADAMILKELFSELFKNGIVLITTSNTLPDNLYKDGLQRERFLPFIPLLQQHCQVIPINHDQDYRLRHGFTAGTQYFYPLTEETQQNFAAAFERATQGQIATHAVVFGEDRPLFLEKAASRTAWVNFDQLCAEPRGTRDYQRLCDGFDHLFLDDIPSLSDNELDQVKRFVFLIDCLYDRGITLTIRASAAPRGLYQGSLLASEFSRTVSRIIEMAHGQRR